MTDAIARTVTIYEVATGRIQRTIHATQDAIDAMTPPGCAAIPGDFGAFSHRVEDGGAVPLPERPSLLHQFDYEALAWFDPRGIEECRSAALAELADYRWQVETGGVQLAGGGMTFTTREHRNTLLQAVTMIDMGVTAEPIPAFKIWDDKWVSASRADLLSYGAQISAHVQACYDAEAQVSAQISASVDPAAINVQEAFDAIYSV